jgi:hypothetical protein
VLGKGEQGQEEQAKGCRTFSSRTAYMLTYTRIDLLDDARDSPIAAPEQARAAAHSHSAYNPNPNPNPKP